MNTLAMKTLAKNRFLLYTELKGNAYMFVNERQSRILQQLEAFGSVQTQTLATQLGTSLATIRRDLEQLQDQGLIRRVYGGAVAVAPRRAADRYFKNRISTFDAQKRAIGKLAASLIREGETILLDIGTTVLEIARNIRGMKELTVVTNSLPVLNELADSSIDVYSLGGQLRAKELAFGGSHAAAALESLYFDKAFWGAGGVTLDNGVSDYNCDAANLHRLALQRAAQSILVVDSSKFGRDVFAFVAGLKDVDLIVTDRFIDPGYQRSLAEMEIRTLIADPEQG